MSGASLVKLHPALRWRGAFVGLTAIAAALLAQWLLHSIDSGFPYPPYSFGDAFIRRTPGDLATEAIERLGSNAREFIVLGTTVAIVAAGALAGSLSRWWAAGAAMALTLIGGWLQPVDPVAGALVAAAVAGGVAAALVAALDAVGEVRGAVARPSPFDRGRRVLLAGGLAAVLGGLAIAAGVERAMRTTSRDAISAVKRLRANASPEFDSVAGLSSLITPPADHYLIDINLARPDMSSAGYILTVRGKVARQLDLTFGDIVALGPVERAIHLQCISNQIGGPLAGNATWSVVPLSAVLDMAGPTDAARTVVVRAHDGYHESYRMEVVPEIFVAVAMGGLEIPDDHGQPIRLLYPGHYGMRSIKWLTSIEVISGEDEGYWQKRGWDDEAVLRLNSRIDRPRPGAQDGRTVTVAGVAWGPEPVTAVELSIDDGASWTVMADLEEPPDRLSWTRWKAELSLEAGEHDIRARAYSGENVQDGEFREPHPSGATGYDLRTLRIS